MKAYIVFEGQAALNAFIITATAAAVSVGLEIASRNEQKAEIEKRIDEYRALPWLKRWGKEEPYYTEELTYGLSILKRYRNEIKALIESATNATAIHIKNDDMDRLMGWAK